MTFSFCLFLQVFQGERPLTKDNYYLNKQFTIDVPPKPAGQVNLDVTFGLDDDGLLTVTCVERSTGERRQITIGMEEAKLGDKDIQDMIEKAERYRKQDQQEKGEIETKLRRKHILV